MNNINYYVLWVKNNSMLDNYIGKYFLLLIEKLELILKNNDFILDTSNIKNINNKDFLINWEISSLINYLSSDWDTENIWEYKNILNNLITEINLFNSNKNNKLWQNKGTLISDTNIRLTISDMNPYNVLDAHPDHTETWGILWWWEREEKEWLNIYESTFKILKKIDEWFYFELNKIITKIIPLWTSRRLHNSASFLECVGHLYLGYTIDSPSPELNNIEALIHESSHNKLNLLMQFDPILLNNMEEKYYSPYRPDARHMKGVFLAIHAFVPTIYVLLKAYNNWFIKDEFWLDKLALYYIKNKITYKVIQKYWNLTDLWKEVFEEITYVLSLTDEMFKSMNLNPKIIKNAIIQQKEHFKKVNQGYPYLEY